MAARHQHGNDHRPFPDGVFDPEYPNRDARSINLKLDELIQAVDAAGNNMIDIEKLSDAALDALQAKFVQIRADCVEEK